MSFTASRFHDIRKGLSVSPVKQWPSAVLIDRLRCLVITIPSACTMHARAAAALTAALLTLLVRRQALVHRHKTILLLF